MKKLELYQPDQKNIFNNNNNSYLFLNDRLPFNRQKEIKEYLEVFLNSESAEKIDTSESYFMIPTSGSTSFDLKLVLLRKTAVLSSAERVGRFFSFKENENWLLTIPAFHIGGLSVMARAHVFKQNVFSHSKWHPEEFCKILADKNIHYVSLVPTQIHDLVEAKLKAPACLKIVFVGGGLLSEELFEMAQKNGWKIVKTFGMTETSSMIAYSNNKEQNYQFFPECTGIVNSEGLLAIKTDSLFSGYLIQSPNQTTFNYHPIQSKDETGFWQTEDFAEIQNSQLFLKGRSQDMIKIKGELVNLTALRSAIGKIINLSLAPSSFTIISRPHVRDENELIFIARADQSDFVKKILAQFNKSVLPFEKIYSFLLVEEIEKTELGKIKYVSFNTRIFQEYLNENRQTIME